MRLVIIIIDEAWSKISQEDNWILKRPPASGRISTSHWYISYSNGTLFFSFPQGTVFGQGYATLFFYKKGLSGIKAPAKELKGFLPTGSHIEMDHIRFEFDAKRHIVDHFFFLYNVKHLQEIPYFFSNDQSDRMTRSTQRFLLRLLKPKEYSCIYTTMDDPDTVDVRSTHSFPYVHKIIVVLYTRKKVNGNNGKYNHCLDRLSFPIYLTYLLFCISHFYIDILFDAAFKCPVYLRMTSSTHSV